MIAVPAKQQLKQNKRAFAAILLAILFL